MSLPALIDAYSDGPTKLRRSVAGLSPEQFRAFPVPGTWSIQQIVLHLMDSDLIATDRMKRIVAEDEPLLAAFNETHFAERLHYHELSVALALDLFDLNRQQTAILLRMLPAETFGRTGRHTERGPVSLDCLLRTNVSHLDHHLEFIIRKRSLLGVPLS